MMSNGLSYGELFAGIGGFGLGFEQAGFYCKWQVEINDFCNSILQKNWPKVKRWGDVAKFPDCHDTDSLSVDVICAGFPCQDLSAAGKKAGLSGDRSQLFFEAIRVTQLLQPRFLVLENVAAILHRGFGQVLSALAEIGFDAEWHCIPATYVGAPHTRDRVFLVAYPNGSLGKEGARVFKDWPNALQPEAYRKYASSVGWNMEAAPRVSGVDYGFPDRIHRITTLGNAVVPQISQKIGLALIPFLVGGET